MFDHYAVLAHQGGWDEMLYAAVPLLVIALLLRKANKRANQSLAARPSGTDPTGNHEGESD